MAISEKATEFAGLPVIEYHPAAGLVFPTMPLRVFRRGDGAAELLRAISLEQNRITTELGQRGAAGKTETRVFPDAAAARSEYRKLVASIVKEGFTEQKQPGGSTREALVSALVDDPDDHVSRMAFADYLSEQGVQLPAVAYRVDEAGWGEEGHGTIANLRSFLAEPAVGLVQGLVIGSCWAAADAMQSSAEVVRALIAARDRLTSLRALFLGDIPYHECEISWIVQSDLTGLLAAFPGLEHFRTRGGNGLVVHELEHQHLKSLAFEASNLPREAVRTIGASKLPSLEHLELWLGTEEYGADTTPDDLAGILQGKHLPSLRSLGLRNSEIADDIAAALAGAPVMQRLRVLDLSLGNLSDRGARALLNIPGVAHVERLDLPHRQLTFDFGQAEPASLARLEKLDIHHHYVSPAFFERLRALANQVDLSEAHEPEDPEDPDEHRYIAHAE
jgi:uncharacterized protein (TIGR02996 family)